MSIFSGCSIQPILPHHDPNEGRIITNDNFKCLEDSITSSTSANTIVQAGANMSVFNSGAIVPPYYIVSTLDNVNFTSMSSQTLTLESTTTAQVVMQPVNATAPADGSMWFTISGGTTLLNYQVSGITKSVELT